MKNPYLAVLLSFIFPGLGQLYTRQIGKGCVLIISGILGIFLIFIIIGIFWYLLIWLYSMYDAYNTAKEINAFIKKFERTS